MARRKIIYVKEVVNYSIDVFCFIDFSLPISVTVFDLFFWTSAHYFMQFNWFLAWQHSENKAVPCQTVNFFPFAHDLWILPEKRRATVSGYWPRQAPDGNLTISISCQCKTQLENKKHICSLGAISTRSKVHSILLWSLWAGGKLWLLGAKLSYFEMSGLKKDLALWGFCVKNK